MDCCDVLIVGGGPAGSACAWRLRDAGVDVALVDKENFPRDKVCGGWVSPAVFHTLGIAPEDYRSGRTLQPVTRFLTSVAGGPTVETAFPEPVSYGIWRREFDEYLLRRSGVRLLSPQHVRALRWDRNAWVVNQGIRARMLVGAGGHFCPVARHLGARPSMEHTVRAQEAEWEMDPRNAELCSVRGNTPELYFDADLRGYGWCFRKGRRLNVGYGRLDDNHLTRHAAKFREFLQSRRCIHTVMPDHFRGHAYLLRGSAERPVVADGVLLVGDAAGMAFSGSGEGILPAVESGLLAADAILSAKGRYLERGLSAYAETLTQRFGSASPSLVSRVAEKLPAAFVRFGVKRLLRNRRFVREFLLDGWFLHKGRLPLNTESLVDELQPLV